MAPKILYAGDKERVRIVDSNIVIEVADRIDHTNHNSRIWHEAVPSQELAILKRACRALSNAPVVASERGTIARQQKENVINHDQPEACQWCKSTQSVTLSAHTPLVWNLIEDMPHCTSPAGGKLRITPCYIPYSYGTTAYVKLQLLTNGGWKSLHDVQFMERNENLLTIEQAAAKLKDYAHYLYCA